MIHSWMPVRCLFHQSVLQECFRETDWKNTPLFELLKVSLTDASRHLIVTGTEASEQAHQLLYQVASKYSVDVHLNSSSIRLPLGENGCIACYYMNRRTVRLFSHPPLVMSITEPKTLSPSRLDSVVFWGHRKGIQDLIANRRQLEAATGCNVISYRVVDTGTSLEVNFSRAIDRETELLSVAAFAIDFLRNFPKTLDYFAGFTWQRTLLRPETTIKNGRAVKCIHTPVGRDDFFGKFHELYY